MSSRLVLLGLITMLSGCVTVQTHHVKVWVLCYRDETLLPNGMYTSDELQHIRCDRRRQLQMLYTPGIQENDVLKGMADWKKSRGD